MFDHLANIYHSFPGRITAETFKKQIIAVVDIWDDWIVFPGEFLVELRSRLEGKAAITTEETSEGPEEVTVASSTKFKTVTSTSNVTESHPPDEDATDGVPVEDVDGDPLSDVDGAPIDDVDGQPMDDIDGEAMMELDGEPMEDVDGEPMEGLDGEPLDGEPFDDMDGAPMAGT